MKEKEWCLPFLLLQLHNRNTSQKQREKTPPDSCQSQGVMIIAPLSSRKAACASIKKRKNLHKTKGIFHVSFAAKCKEQGNNMESKKGEF